MAFGNRNALVSIPCRLWRRSQPLQLLALVGGMLFIFVPVLWPQTADQPSGVPVTVIVSVEAKHGREMPTIYKEDVRVLLDRDRMPVIEWTPLEQGESSAQLLLAIDDTVDPSIIGMQFHDLRKFIRGLPGGTEIGIGYIHFGMVQIAHDFTADHEAALRALRLPLGGASGMSSPYIALKDVMRSWPEATSRRIILMISSGVDALQPGPNDMYLDQAIDEAQRTGTQIFAIYAGLAGTFVDPTLDFTWGQNNLIELADATGGEAYFQAMRTPMSFAPYLDEVAGRISHQYRLTFLAGPTKAGLRRLKLYTEVPGVKLIGPERVFVPAN
ncbi:MAG TPA: hypothetical protein VE783_05630 [Candidatus Limnocylindrales bacterium]|nr:hypothetical protein [Candidatus Limnocylindrales bacterium]